MESSRNRLEQRIADLFGYGDAVLFGRARSGVLALLDILGLNRSSGFVMPSNLCSSLFLAVHSCGVQIGLAGVSEANGLSSDEALIEAMQRASQPGVVMPTHLYGFVQPYPKTLAYAHTHGWFVLENDTIATKARYSGARRSAFGDALVVSFGYAKTIEVGGGGAVLTDDAALANALRIAGGAFPLLDDAAQKAEDEFMLFSRSLRNGQLDGTALSAHAGEAMLFERSPDCRFRFPETLEAPLSHALNRFEQAVDSKRQKLELWNHFLQRFDSALFVPEADCVVPWRLIRRVPGIRNTIVAALRNKKIDAGTNFPLLTHSFPALFAGQHYTGAAQWGREVLNLWLTADYGPKRMMQAAGVIENLLSQHNENDND